MYMMTKLVMVSMTISDDCAVHHTVCLPLSAHYALTVHNLTEETTRNKPHCLQLAPQQNFHSGLTVRLGMFARVRFRARDCCHVTKLVSDKAGERRNVLLRGHE